MTPCECNNSSPLLATRNTSHVGSFTSVSCKDSCTVRTATRAKMAGSDSPLCGQSQTFSARHAFNDEVRLSAGTIGTASSKTLPSSVHTLFWDDFAGRMMLLHKIQSVRAGSDLPSQCFRKMQSGILGASLE